MFGKVHGLIEIFTEGLGVPTATERMPITALQEVFPTEGIQKHLIAMAILSRVLGGRGDRDTLRHGTPPTAGWCALVDTHTASTLSTNVQCLQSLY